MKKIWKHGLFFALIIGIICCLILKRGPALQTSSVKHGAPTLVLDAGHGGEDGGAVSPSGVTESNINLAIVRRMELLFAFYGRTPVVLRREDVSLHSDTADTLREKKTSDLKNRVAAVEATENAVLLSIHQNMFTDPQYHGAQVFFAPTFGSEALAIHVQQILREAVDPENGRQAKPIPDTVYLMNHISCPAILIECGFLSNPIEEEKLRTSTYQLQLSAALVGAWLQYEDTFLQQDGAA